MGAGGGSLCLTHGATIVSVLPQQVMGGDGGIISTHERVGPCHHVPSRRHYRTGVNGLRELKGSLDELLGECHLTPKHQLVEQRPHLRTRE